ncbi:MAG: methyltransferase domain-containing protein [Pseudomonadota bacterium]
MRRVVMSSSYTQADIKPYELFKKYLEIVDKEVKRLLIDKNDLKKINCPACKSDNSKFAFKKFGLAYAECLQCGSLYISPRPSDDKINKYFLKSRATAFWNEHILKKTIQSRVQHLIRPEVMWVANTTGTFCKEPNTFIEIKSRYPEFLEGIEQLKLFKEKIIIDPEMLLSESFVDKNGFTIIKDLDRNNECKNIKADVATGFYLLDRLSEPYELLKTLNSMLLDKGLLFLISTTISGLDLQVLWENSNAIFPPENMNILSIEGFKILLDNCGFEIIELSTPGQLDLEYIKNAMKYNKNLQIPRFLSYFINNRDERAQERFQEFLQEVRLSSHLRIVARKK